MHASFQKLGLSLKNPRYTNHPHPTAHMMGDKPTHAAGASLMHSEDEQDGGSYTSTEGESESSRLEGQLETEPGESSQQQQHHDEQEKPLTFKTTVTRDSLCLILANLHPRDGLTVLCLCCSIRSLAGKELWEWWALALWPERLVLPSVPRLYPDFEALVRDDNRRGAILTLKWPDVGNDQTVCLYTGNRPTYYFACRVLAVEYDRHQSLLSVHFDVRGEGDLVQPGHARLFLLGPKTLEIASPIPHRVCRLVPGRESYIAVPVPSVLGVATLAAYPPAIGLWTFENNLEVTWSRSVTGKRCTGHITFHVKRFEERLRLPSRSSTSTLNMTRFEERQRVAPRSSTSTFNMTRFEERRRVAPGSSTSTSTFNMTRFEERQRVAPVYCSAKDGAPLQLKFVYSMDPSYTPVTLAEWPASKRLSVTEALTEHSCHGPEIGMHATGEMSGLVNASGVGGVVGDAKERFDFVPDNVKLKPEWWA